MKCILIILFLGISVAMKAQQLPDSTRKYLQDARTDLEKYKAVLQAYNYFEERNRDSALFYAEQGLTLTRKNNVRLQEAAGLTRKGYQLTSIGQYAKALSCFIEAFEIAENSRNESNDWFTVVLPPHQSRLLILSFTHHMYAVLMGHTHNSEQLIFHNKEAKRLAQEVDGIPGKQRVLLADMNLGSEYVRLQKYDSALVFLEEARNFATTYSQKKYLGYILVSIGELYRETGDQLKEKQFYDEAMASAIEQGNIASLARIFHSLSVYYRLKNEKDSSLLYALKMQDALLSLGPVISSEINMSVAYEDLYRSYASGNQTDSALKYADLLGVTKDSVYTARINSLAGFQSLSLQEQQRLQALEKEKTNYRNKIRTYFLLGGIGLLFLLAIFFYRNNRMKHKANIELNQAYKNLQATQQQLIQSEKMASLGELTAGIAHEIQNPLNFINNFSEVNIELLEEMNEEIQKGNYSEAANLAKDITVNQEKINHHGKRADAIVKGMLQHSRNNSGQKEAVDINALADEYLRLAYHGLRARDKSFNATIKTDYDQSIGRIDIISQDIGRVILNLITNAFYAVAERKKSEGNEFEPTVTVSTRKSGSKIELRVKDNGNGIPTAIKDKIFQPFFTTKPTGQGTGLGLSLSYDIVKAHQGQLKVESTEGKGSEFIVII